MTRAERARVLALPAGSGSDAPYAASAAAEEVKAVAAPAAVISTGRAPPGRREPVFGPRRDRGDSRRPIAPVEAMAVIQLTGLRTPCRLLDGIRKGLMAATREKVGRRVCFKAGVMAVVVAGGAVRPGGAVRVELPPGPHRPLQPL